MSDPLHPPFKLAGIRPGGNFYEDLARRLVEAANVQLAIEDYSPDAEDPNETDRAYCCYWLNRIERFGVTRALVRDLNKHALDVPLRAYWTIGKETGALEAQFGLGIDATQLSKSEVTANRKYYIALYVAMTLASGAFAGLKRCHLTECRKFFIGGERAKWCSDTCGSKYRVRRKRKRDRLR